MKANAVALPYKVGLAVALYMMGAGFSVRGDFVRLDQARSACRSPNCQHLNDLAQNRAQIKSLFWPVVLPWRYAAGTLLGAAPDVGGQP